LLLAAAPYGLAQNPPSDITKLSLEELLDIDVTSVSRRPEPLGQTAAAVTVITSEDIRRSGVTSIPEALRLVPGLEVARFNAGSWAISSRGFNSTAANKLLVMIDGRTVYSPLFSGTFWEVQDMPLDDIARIEVVRGPGATLWGANAVNGVINIITKSAHQTKGTVVILTGAGADDLAVGTLRQGAGLGPDTSYRVFGKYFYRDQLKFANGDDAHDSMRLGRTGFRLDSVHNADEFTVTGDFYRGLAGLLNRPDAKILGGSMLGRWTRTISNRSQLQLQTSYERIDRRVPLQSDFHQKIFDIDLQHQITLGSHNVVWGGGYRWNNDATIPTLVLFFSPQDRTYPVWSGFVQDEVALRGNEVKLTLGSKFLHNDFSGFDIQPSVRVSWAVRADHFVWAAVTRAVRTPTRFDTDIQFGPPGLQIVGNPDFNSENVVTYEVGYRSGAQRLSYDISTFFNVYDNLRSLELAGLPGSIMEFNNLDAHTYGGEVAAKYDAFEWLRFNAGYSFLQEHFKTDAGHFDVFNGTIEGNDPTHQFFARGSADLAHNVELDSTLRFVSQLPSPVVPRYTELDARFGWNPKPEIELSIIGRNLLDKQHPEFGPPGPFRVEVQRNIYGRVAFRF